MTHRRWTLRPSPADVHRARETVRDLLVERGGRHVEETAAVVGELTTGALRRGDRGEDVTFLVTMEDDMVEVTVVEDPSTRDEQP